MKKKLLIFDVDGTIWDSEKDVYLAFNHTLKENADFEITKDEFKKLAGMPLENMFKNVLPEDKKNLSEEYAKKYRKYYIDGGHYIDTTTLFNNVKNTLNLFKNKGFYMAVASSKPKRILDKMIEYFELECFQIVLGTGESNLKNKPDPEIANYIMEHFKISKEDTVIIGDSKSDILCGKNADIDTIAVTYGYDTIENLVTANPTVIIDDFEELINILER